MEQVAPVAIGDADGIRKDFQRISFGKVADCVEGPAFDQFADQPVGPISKSVRSLRAAAGERTRVMIARVRVCTGGSASSSRPGRRQGGSLR
jgi:hypothetical protein